MPEIASHVEKKPWGEFKEFIHNAPCTVKIITVEPGQAISLQIHELREEYWYVISGIGTVTIGDEEFPAAPGNEFVIPKTIKHRMKADQTGPLVILEVSQGDFNEDDIIRLDDLYGRAERS